MSRETTTPRVERAWFQLLESTHHLSSRWVFKKLTQTCVPLRSGRGVARRRRARRRGDFLHAGPGSSRAGAAEVHVPPRDIRQVCGGGGQRVRPVSDWGVLGKAVQVEHISLTPRVGKHVAFNCLELF